jgi:hypothetical protein
MADLQSSCQAVINVAMPLVGCHYLWGAAGATPGGSEGIMRRPGSVDLVDPPRTDPTYPAIFTAQCAVDGLHVCGGRWDGTNGGIPGGRPANATDGDLVAYLAGLAALDPSLWQPYFQSFAPRMQEGRTVTRRLVWGEDCRNVQHFDCVGFVNYCVELSLGRSKQVQYSIAQWGSDAIGATSAVDMSSDPFPADVLINASATHIGLMVGDGNIINAEQASVGVVTRTFDPAKWGSRRRLTAYMLGAS